MWHSVAQTLFCVHNKLLVTVVVSNLNLDILRLQDVATTTTAATTVTRIARPEKQMVIRKLGKPLFAIFSLQ